MGGGGGCGGGVWTRAPPPALDELRDEVVLALDGGGSGPVPPCEAGTRYMASGSSTGIVPRRAGVLGPPREVASEFVVGSAGAAGAAGGPEAAGAGRGEVAGAPAPGHPVALSINPPTFGRARRPDPPIPPAALV